MTQEEIALLISKGHGGLFIGSPQKEASNSPETATEADPKAKPERRKPQPQESTPESPESE